MNDSIALGAFEHSIESLWATYHVNKDRALRDRLIEAHIPLVEYVARRMLPKMHTSVEMQDLVSYGMFGLIDAVERFDPRAGVKFSTFAPYRIQGAITDELRSQAWEPRSVRARHRAVLDATDRLEHALGRLPSEQEVATDVGITPVELRRIIGDIDSAKVGSLSVVVRDGEDQQMQGRDVGVLDAAEQLPELDEAGFRLASGLGHLSEHERLLLRLIYVKGVPLKKIAQTLGVTESWVSHLHTKVMVRLQRTLAGQF